MMPSGGPRQGEPPPSSLDVGSEKDRRDLTRAAEFVASMPGDQAQQFSGRLAAEMKQLAETVGPAEDGRQEHAERMSLTLDLADDVEQQAAEGAEAQLEFYAWAMEQFGGREEFFRWADEQDDPKAAMVELAEEYLVGQEEGEDAAGEDGEHDDEPSDADIAFSAWVTETIGEHGIAQLSRLGDADYEKAIGELGEAFYDEHPERTPEDGGEGASHFDDDGAEDDGGDLGLGS